MQFTDRLALATVASLGIGHASAGLPETPIHRKTERRDVEEVRTPGQSLEGELPLAGKPGSPEQQVREDLRHFKQVMEAGEVPSVQGQPSCRGRD
jgi:hypothetical protein